MFLARRGPLFVFVLYYSPSPRHSSRFPVEAARRHCSNGLAESIKNQESAIRADSVVHNRHWTVSHCVYNRAWTNTQGVLSEGSYIWCYIHLMPLSLSLYIYKTDKNQRKTTSWHERSQIFGSRLPRGFILNNWTRVKTQFRTRF